jgi:acetolactate synthase-1/3 small subunit
LKTKVLSALVENQAGVLARVTALFSRRNFNIDSLSVGETEDSKFSRITIATSAADDKIIAQISKQLEKLFVVIKVIELSEDDAIFRELCLVKIKAVPEQRPEIIAIAEIFRANIKDVSNQSMIIEITGSKSKIEGFIKLMEPYEIKEMARTGVTGLARGPVSINEIETID